MEIKMENIKRKIRCAIYTRKSCEEGLDMEYNSLDNQRDSCEKYISSQENEGWVLVNKRYDDGGYSGGNLERPALKELLNDIENGLIDMVVVYKIDRLSRSLMDFSKLVDIFNKNNTSFISITQNFNTNDSMGKLMLNILLSFAQFEREMTGDRIRDKIRAQKSKGMWTGGIPPFGYDVKDKKLIVNENESKIVKMIFDNFIKNNSVDCVLNFLKQNNYKTKTYISNKGNVINGQSFNRNAIYRILKNKVYIGLIENKKTNDIFVGQHKAIINDNIFNQVQEIFKTNIRESIYNIQETIETNSATNTKTIKKQYIPKTNSKMPYLLRGLLKCACCNSIMTPLFTVKKKSGIAYRYYKSNKAIKHTTNCEIGNIPAEQIENIVLNEVYTILKTPSIVNSIINRINDVKDINNNVNNNLNNNINISETEIINYLKNIEVVWNELFPKEQMDIIRILIKEIIVSKTNVKIVFNQDGIINLLKEAGYIDINTHETNNSNNYEINIAVDFSKKAGRSFITTPNNKELSYKISDTKKLFHNFNSNDLTLINTLILAENWKHQLETNKLININTIAKSQNKSNSYICRILNLVFLAPDIKKAILDNKAPAGLTLLDLYACTNLTWNEQRAKLKI